MSASTLTYQVEAFADAWPDAQELIQLHWREIARDQETIPLEPDLEFYRAIDQAKALLIVTARDGGTLVGYHASLIRPHMHYRNSMTAFTDLFFIHKDYRSGRNAWRLFRKVEQELAARGVQRMFASCKLSLDLLPLFKALGWNEIERTFSKKPEL